MRASNDDKTKFLIIGSEQHFLNYIPKLHE